MGINVVFAIVRRSQCFWNPAQCNRQVCYMLYALCLCICIMIALLSKYCGAQTVFLEFISIKFKKLYTFSQMMMKIKLNH